MLSFVHPYIHCRIDCSQKFSEGEPKFNNYSTVYQNVWKRVDYHTVL